MMPVAGSRFAGLEELHMSTNLERDKPRDCIVHIPASNSFGIYPIPHTLSSMAAARKAIELHEAWAPLPLEDHLLAATVRHGDLAG
jgi:hypothetical protein